MEKNKAPVVIVLAALLALIVSSIVLLLVLKKGDSNDDSPKSSEHTEAVVDFELSQLAEKAKKSVNKDLAEALREGDVPIDFISALKKDLDKADEYLEDENLGKARDLYTEIIATAEARLENLELAASARELRDSTYTKLSNAKYLKAAFENTYNEAVAAYDQGIQSIGSGDFETGIASFETTNEILKELEEQSTQKIKAQLEAANTALSQLDSATARAAFESVLKADASNEAATQGLVEAKALEAIDTEMDSIQSLLEAGENEAALAQINKLIEKNPGNSFLLKECGKIEAVLSDAKREAIIKQADIAEAKGAIKEAIAALEEANLIRTEEKTTERIKTLKAEEMKKHLEVLLETAYNGLKAGNYETAKVAYEEALKKDPQSEEAKKGLEKASSLYLANIRYNKSIESAAKYLSEGRIPLATKFFNEALTSRPSNISFKQKDEEARIRTALDAQREKVGLLLVSDDKTYVSMIGVFAPERFKEKEVMLYPDVYTVKGTRSNHKSVEFDVKVSKSMKPGGIEVICSEKL